MQMTMEKMMEVAILISNKIDFKTKAIKRDKEGHYVMLWRSIQQEGITLVNIYALNIAALKCIKQMIDINGKIDSNINAVIVADFNTPLTSIDRYSIQKINKEIVVLIDTLDKMDLIDIFRAFHPKAARYIFFQVHMGHFPR